jgi:hypothetical protein
MVGNALRRFGLRKRKPPSQAARDHRHSPKEFDLLLLHAGLDKVETLTLGFGPFSFFGHRLLADPMGIKIHNMLQSLANRSFPLVGITGSHYIVVAKRQVFGKESSL